MTVRTFSSLTGETIERIKGMKNGSEEVELHLASGVIVRLLHVQDCCESVSVEDVCGNPDDLVGSKLIVAQESSNAEETSLESCLWTFYTLGTMKGYVTLRWLGTSNGYYSEAVDCVFEDRKESKKAE